MVIHPGLPHEPRPICDHASRGIACNCEYAAARRAEKESAKPAPLVAPNRHFRLCALALKLGEGK